MSLDKITFLRDESKESAEISRFLDENKIKFIEIYSTSERGPFLIIPNKSHSIRGYMNIKNYIKSNYIT